MTPEKALIGHIRSKSYNELKTSLTGPNFEKLFKGREIDRIPTILKFYFPPVLCLSHVFLPPPPHYLVLVALLLPRPASLSLLFLLRRRLSVPLALSLPLFVFFAALLLVALSAAPVFVPFRCFAAAFSGGTVA